MTRVVLAGAVVVPALLAWAVGTRNGLLRLRADADRAQTLVEAELATRDAVAARLAAATDGAERERLESALARAEDRVASASRYHEATVSDLAEKVGTVPTSLVARLTGIDSPR